jgi:hypothetical protein
MDPIRFLRFYPNRGFHGTACINGAVLAYRDAQELTIFRLLLMPFRRQRPTWQLPDGNYPDRQETGDQDFLAA